LINMPAPRSNTVLVNGIPDQYCSDKRLKKFFEDTLDKKGIVKEAFVIKKTYHLINNIAHKNHLVEQSGLMSDLHKESPDAEVSHACCGERKSHADHKADVDAQVEVLTKEIQAEREEIFNLEAMDDEMKDIDTNVRDKHNNVGFVTFHERRDCEIAMKLTYMEDEDQFACEIPPDPADVVYKDFMVDETTEAASESIGWGLVGALFLGYMPIIVGISSVASLDTLREHVALFAHIIDNYPSLAAMWDGLVGALALTIMVGFIPTFLALIFSNFFALRAEAWMQYKIQVWYYYFNLVFVLLVTAVGASLLTRLEALIKSPTSIFHLLASTMPTASHFYLNLFPANWTTHATVLLRHVSYFKFTLWHKIYQSDEKADQMARDKACEDQDYYGMGSRSARFTIMVVVAVTFCTLSPLMCLLSFINSGLCRLFYGYLFAYAESVKADLGGVFFVSQCRSVLQGLFIYIVLMAGVLFYRGTDKDGNGPGILPGIIAGLSMFLAIPTYTRFDRKFHWEDLPFSKVTETMDPRSKRKARRLTYQQPELCE